MVVISSLRRGNRSSSLQQQEKWNTISEELLACIATGILFHKEFQERYDRAQGEVSLKLLEKWSFVIQHKSRDHQLKH